MPMSATRQQFPICKRKIFKKMLRTLIFWFFLLGCLLGVPYATFVYLESVTKHPIDLTGVYPIVTLSVIVFAALLVALSFIYQCIYFVSYYYEIGADNVVIRKGVFTSSEITIPVERIQDVSVDQDFLDRIFGLYDVHLSSAGLLSGMRAHIDGVNQKSMEGLRALLMSKVKERMSK